MKFTRCGFVSRQMLVIGGSLVVLVALVAALLYQPAGTKASSSQPLVVYCAASK